MLLIPFPFVTATVFITALLVLRGVVLDRGERPSLFFTAFITLCAVQSLLIGIRHGYGVMALAPLLPVSAMLIPPLAWASFARPPIDRSLGWHLLPALVVVVAWWVLPPLIDVLVPLVFIGYAVQLLRLALGPEAGLSWVRMGQMVNGRRALTIVAVSLISSALSDVAIALDFGATDGRRLGQILLVMQTVSIAGVCLLLWGSIPTAATHSYDDTDPTDADDATDEATDRQGHEQYAVDFAVVDAGVRERKLFLDPGLNLQRLARKVGQPTRRVSQAVNAIQGVNVSVWINNLRIEEAQRLLSDPGKKVTEVIYECGFNTKSSFNREFKRVAGAPPSVWRRGLEQSQ